MNKNIKSFLEEEGYSITDEVSTHVEQLCDLLDAQKKSDDVSEILEWLEERRAECQIVTNEIGIKDIDGWKVDSATGNISHDSGKFFTIMGISVDKAKEREVSSWTQPMIKQQECGILGILCKKMDGVRHYLLYAKYEPGNINKIQLSPALQATDSNLKRAHGGKKPLLAEYFEDSGKGKVLCSVVSVEDGSRFYLKTNRNMIVEVDEGEDIDVPNNFIWLTLPQIKKLLKMDNVVNSLARSIFGSWH